MSKTPKHIDSLIVRFLTGEAAMDEKQELKLWLEASESNCKYFEGFRFINEKAESCYPGIKVNVDKGWSNVKERMKQKSTAGDKPSKSIVIHMPAWLRIAAMIVFIAVVSWMLMLQLHKPTNTTPGLLTIASKDSIITRKLTDKTELTLNRYSEIKYPKNFGKDKRVVALEGEAFFKVKSMADMPFIIYAGEVFIEQLGTSFNIKSNPADTLVEVFVKTGNVKFYNTDYEGIKLSDGETGIYCRNNQKFTKSVENDVNLLSYTNKTFVFEKSPIVEVLDKLSSVYNTTIIVKGEPVAGYSITTTFFKKDIDFILDIITKTLDLELTKTDEGYLINNNLKQNNI